MSYTHQQKVLYYLGKYLQEHPERRKHLINYMETNQTNQTNETTANVETANAAAPATSPENKAQEVNEPAKLSTEEEKPCYKLTEEEFLQELEENNGLYAQTAKAIRWNYGIPYTRQAVRERAQKYYDLQNTYQERIIELAKGTIFNAVEQETDKKLKYRAASFLLSKLKYGKLFKS
jgi:hypothetical protein